MKARNLALGALAFLLVCGTGQAQDASDAPVGGTLQIATTDDPVFNWFQHSSLPTLYVHKVFYNSLARISGETMEPEPDLAINWESSEGGKVWTFDLRDDVTWHDGVPFTAEDVKFTYDAITSENSPRAEARLAQIDEVEVLDPYTVRFVLTQAVAPAPLNLSFNVPILPQHRFVATDFATDTTFNASPIGTGPYKFAEQVRGSHILLEANEDYFGGRPNIDRLVFRVIPDINTQIALLRSGELDIAVIEPTNLAAVQNDPNIEIVAAEGTTYFYHAFNTRKAPFDDQRVRLALTLALDRQAIIDAVLGGYASLGVGPVPPSLVRYFNDDLEPRPFDPDGAIELLAEAGWQDSDGDGVLDKNGEPLNVEILTDRGNPTRERVVALTQQYWRAIGVAVSVNALEWSNFVQTYQQTWDDEGVRPWDVAHVWIGLAPDPDGMREYYTYPDRLQGGRWGYSNPEVDELLVAGLAETDLDARADIYKEFQRLVYEDAPLAYLYYPQELIAVRSGVEGIPPAGGLRVALAHIEKWFIDR